MLKEAIMKLAMDKFMDELKNPNSMVSKKFNSMLFGDPAAGTPGLFEQELNNLATTVTGGSGKSAPTDKEIDDEVARYKRSTGEAIATNGLNVLGEAAGAAGNAYSLYNGLLGDALLAVSGGLKTNGYTSPFFMAPAIAAGKKAKGGIAQVVGNSASNISKGIAADIKNNNEKDRETELLIRQHPNNGFYESRRSLNRNTYDNKQ